MSYDTYLANKDMRHFKAMDEEEAYSEAVCKNVDDIIKAVKRKQEDIWLAGKKWSWWDIWEEILSEQSDAVFEIVFGNPDQGWEDLVECCSVLDKLASEDLDWQIGQGKGV